MIAKMTLLLQSNTCLNSFPLQMASTSVPCLQLSCILNYLQHLFSYRPIPQHVAPRKKYNASRKPRPGVPKLGSVSSSQPCKSKSKFQGLKKMSTFVKPKASRQLKQLRLPIKIKFIRITWCKSLLTNCKKCNGIVFPRVRWEYLWICPSKFV